ncbi:MAG: methylmalonyl-CoA epimerase [Calditrichaceae bacterium]
MLKQIDHIGIAVPSLDDIIKTYKDAFEMDPVFSEIVPDQKVNVAGFHVGESTIEYLEPSAPDSPIASFLEKRGTGIHHLAFRVENLAEKLLELKAKGFRLIDETPRPGAEGKKIAFLHPKSTNGILIELCEI